MAGKNLDSLHSPMDTKIKINGCSCGTAQKLVLDFDVDAVVVSGRITVYELHDVPDNPPPDAPLVTPRTVECYLSRIEQEEGSGDMTIHIIVAHEDMQPECIRKEDIDFFKKEFYPEVASD